MDCTDKLSNKSQSVLFAESTRRLLCKPQNCICDFAPRLFTAAIRVVVRRNVNVERNRFRRIFINDASCLIDLHKVGLVEVMLQMPYAFDRDLRLAAFAFRNLLASVASVSPVKKP